MSNDHQPTARGTTAVEVGRSQLLTAEEPLPGLRARCWGTRGSMPSPGMATAGYGGNTSCIEVLSRDRRFIFDAGSGIRLLGQELANDSEPIRAELFLTHFHWDHIQGLPFFGPLYSESTRLRVHGPKQDDIDIRTLIAGQMGPIYFPVPFETVAAHMDFEHLTEEPWSEDGVTVESIRVRHAAHTRGYKITADGATMGYFPDNELFGGKYPQDAKKNYDDIVLFLAGVDVLFHDAMYTDAEYPRRDGWGHSTFTQAVKLAEDAAVRRLYLFHHAPERSDAELTQILDELRDDLARRGSPLELGVAAEGDVLIVAR